MGVTSVAVQFTIIDLLSKGVDRIKDRMAGLSRMNDQVRKSFERMNTSFKVALISGIATRELYRGIKPAVAMASDLQSELAGVRAELMGANKPASRLAAEMRSIKKTAFEVQAWAPFDMTQIVALEKELVKGGAKIQSITGTKGAAAAATALATYENMEPALAGKALIGIGTPFRIAADGYMDLADKISRAGSASIVSGEEIAMASKYVAGPMANMGRSIDEMLALTASLAQAGIIGEQAGTSLRSFFLRAAQSKMFRDKTTGNLLPTVKILDILKEKTKEMGDAQKATFLKKIFDETSISAVMALLKEGEGSYATIDQAIREGNSLQEKLNIRMQTFSAQLTSLKGTARSTISLLFLPMLEPLTSVVSKMKEFVSYLGMATQKSEALAKSTSNITLGGLAVGGTATAAATIAGLYFGRKVLKGVGGFKGLLGGMTSAAGGIAQGKAVEAATGVTPVFVVNWPDGFGSGAAVGEKRHS
jgi:TP901 family phage tail tape measure protein